MDPLLVAVLVGLGVGVVVGALGAGGGILSIPVLVYLLGQSPHAAAASSLVIVCCTAAVGLIHHVRRGTIDWPNGLAFGLLGIAGSFAGSRLAARIDEQLLMTLFAVLLAGVSVVMFFKSIRGGRAERHSAAPSPLVARAVERPLRWSAWLKIIVLATLTGVLTGFFGVGGGFVVVPVLVLVMKASMRTASGTSLVVMVIASASGLLARLGTNVVIDWRLTLSFAAASMVGGLLGGPASTRAKDWVLTLVFACLLAGASLVILTRGAPNQP